MASGLDVSIINWLRTEFQETQPTTITITITITIYRNIDAEWIVHGL